MSRLHNYSAVSGRKADKTHWLPPAFIFKQQSVLSPKIGRAYPNSLPILSMRWANVIPPFVGMLEAVLLEIFVVRYGKPLYPSIIEIIRLKNPFV